MQTVIKRNGERVPFDIQKIRKQCEFATEETGLNPLELESNISMAIKNNITTKEIQELLVHTCMTMIDIDTPNWILVAGRLMMRQLHREIYKNTKIDYNEFDKFIEYAKNNHYYRKDITEVYSNDDILELANEIQKNTKSDYTKVLPQVLSLKSKYLLKHKKGIIEYPLFSDMASAMILGSVSVQPVKQTKEYFEMLHKEYISLATPFKSNLRILGGNTGSCFIMGVPDNLTGISKSWSDVARISKEGGGVGMYLGYLRPGGSYSKNIPKANEVTKWVKIINDIAVAVNQRGIRPGAITPAIDWWHLDVESFIEVKTETGGDLREKSFDIYPQVVVDKYFVDKKKNNEDVYLFDHYEYKQLTGKVINDLVDDELYQAHIEVEKLITNGKLKNFKKINTKTLWSEFLRVWVEIGDFYIVHKDNINLSNYLKPEGYLAQSANLCTESWSITKTGDNFLQKNTNGDLQTLETDSLYHSCLTGDTILDTNYGKMTLEEVSKEYESKNIKVKSYDTESGKIEYKNIVWGGKTRKDAKLMKITAESGEFIRCTPDHQVWTKNRGYVEAQHLLETDEVLID